MSAETKYQVIDGHHGMVVSTHGSSVAAHRKADKLDAEYGSYRYGVRTMTQMPDGSLVDPRVQEVAQSLLTTAAMRGTAVAKYGWETTSGRWSSDGSTVTELDK